VIAAITSVQIELVKCKPLVPPEGVLEGDRSQPACVDHDGWNHRP
jgi:hypothetical protein